MNEKRRAVQNKSIINFEFSINFINYTEFQFFSFWFEMVNLNLENGCVHMIWNESDSAVLWALVAAKFIVNVDIQLVVYCAMFLSQITFATYLVFGKSEELSEWNSRKGRWMKYLYWNHTAYDTHDKIRGMGNKKPTMSAVRATWWTIVEWIQWKINKNKFINLGS